MKEGVHIGEPQEAFRPGKTGYDGGNPEPENDCSIGLAPQQNKLEQVVQEVHDSCQGNGHVEREEKGKEGQQERPQAES